MKWSCAWCMAVRRGERDRNGVLQLPWAVFPDELCSECRRLALDQYGAGDWPGWSQPKRKGKVRHDVL